MQAQFRAGMSLVLLLATQVIHYVGFVQVAHPGAQGKHWVPDL